MSTAALSQSSQPSESNSSARRDADLLSTPGLDPTARAASAGDPLTLGLPLIVIGAIALGLQLVGYVNTTSVGSPLALIIAASGLGLLTATIWATRIEQSPASSPWRTGSSLPTTILGVLAAFFLSYAALVLGLLHSWYGIQPTDVQHTQALFQISWLVTFLFLAIASLRLPAAFTVLFVAFSLVLVFLLISTLDPSQTAGKIGGVIALVIAAAAGYVFLSVSSSANGGREYPLGPVLQK